MDTTASLPDARSAAVGPDGGADVERHRRRLFGVAYRMLGDAHEAEDLVQEAYLRWHRAAADDRAAVASPEGWLVAVVTRLAIDRLRRAEVERTTYVGDWLPEPVSTAEPPPDRAIELASDLSVALLVLLERLAPEERAAFLLREVFDTGYPEIARILGRNEPAVRQMVHRAQQRVRAGRARFAAPPGAQERLLRRFLDALHADDHEALLGLQAADATYTSDGGGKVTAARRTIVGADRIVRLLRGLEAKWGHVVAHELATLNGMPAIVTRIDGRVFAATSFATDGARIVAAYRVLNPDKLRRLQPDAR
jgi:RNA polymerase sigma-70 factor (ECF subfamily)